MCLSGKWDLAHLHPRRKWALPVLLTSSCKISFLKALPTVRFEGSFCFAGRGAHTATAAVDWQVRAVDGGVESSRRRRYNCGVYVPDRADGHCPSASAQQTGRPVCDSVKTQTGRPVCVGGGRPVCANYKRGLKVPGDKRALRMLSRLWRARLCSLGSKRAQPVCKRALETNGA